MAHSLDDLDRQIVALLQADGRTSNVEIARRLGIAEGTVRKRLERLLDAGFMRVTAVLDPPSLGLGTQLFVGVEADLSRVHEVAARLAQIPEVYSVRLVTGAYDVIIDANLPSGEQLLSFLVDKVAAIPGVKRTETCHVMKVTKRGCDWEVPPPASPQPPEAPGGIIPGAIVVPG